MIIKVVLLHFVFFLFLAYYGIKFLMGKEKSQQSGKVSRFSRIFGFLLLLLALAVFIEIGPDFLLKDEQEIEITVTKTDPPQMPAFYKKSIISESGERFEYYFNTFEIHKNKTYRIKYLKRSKIITDVQSNENSP